MMLLFCFWGSVGINIKHFHRAFMIPERLLQFLYWTAAVHLFLWLGVWEFNTTQCYFWCTKWVGKPFVMKKRNLENENVKSSHFRRCVCISETAAAHTRWLLTVGCSCEWDGCESKGLGTTGDQIFDGFYVSIKITFLDSWVVFETCLRCLYLLNYYAFLTV